MTDRSHENQQDDLRNLVRVVSACTLGLWAFAAGLLIGGLSVFMGGVLVVGGGCASITTGSSTNFEGHSDGRPIATEWVASALAGR